MTKSDLQQMIREALREELKQSLTESTKPQATTVLKKSELRSMIREALAEVREETEDRFKYKDYDVDDPKIREFIRGLEELEKQLNKTYTDYVFTGKGSAQGDRKHVTSISVSYKDMDNPPEGGQLGAKSYSGPRTFDPTEVFKEMDKVVRNSPVVKNANNIKVTSGPYGYGAAVWSFSVK